MPPRVVYKPNYYDCSTFKFTHFFFLCGRILSNIVDHFVLPANGLLNLLTGRKILLLLFNTIIVFAKLRRSLNQDWVGHNGATITHSTIGIYIRKLVILYSWEKGGLHQLLLHNQSFYLNTSIRARSIYGII